MPSLLATSLSEKLERWQNQVREPSLTVLLLGQVLLLFVVSPLSSVHVVTYAVVGGLQVLLLVISYFALPQRSKVRSLLLICLAPTLWVLIAGSNLTIGLALRMVATLGVTIAVGQAVFRAQRVTSHQLLGAVVVYLNLAQLFMGAFIALNNELPGAFTTLTKTALKPGELLYFSLTTLTSTGYGDILPVHPLARSLANLEAVVGQLFLAILLARLVSQRQERAGKYHRGAASLW
ncbi:two pore domain potassium channel family protein [Siccationidurans ginsengisoli]|nr:MULTISPECIES: potassium channel family protein [unclassified Hymenobacter]MBO2033526.1 two pore domain potassium channel family protein [Hymenobacter sp. BT559]